MNYAVSRHLGSAIFCFICYLLLIGQQQVFAKPIINPHTFAPLKRVKYTKSFIYRKNFQDFLLVNSEGDYRYSFATYNPVALHSSSYKNLTSQQNWLDVGVSLDQSLYYDSEKNVGYMFGYVSGQGTNLHRINFNNNPPTYKKMGTFSGKELSYTIKVLYKDWFIFAGTLEGTVTPGNSLAIVNINDPALTIEPVGSLPRMFTMPGPYYFDKSENTLTILGGSASSNWDGRVVECNLSNILEPICSLNGHSIPKGSYSKGRTTYDESNKTLYYLDVGENYHQDLYSYTSSGGHHLHTEVSYFASLAMAYHPLFNGLVVITKSLYANLLWLENQNGALVSTELFTTPPGDAVYDVVYRQLTNHLGKKKDTFLFYENISKGYHPFWSYDISVSNLESYTAATTAINIEALLDPNIYYDDILDKAYLFNTKDGEYATRIYEIDFQDTQNPLQLVGVVPNTLLAYTPKFLIPGSNGLFIFAGSLSSVAGQGKQDGIYVVDVYNLQNTKLVGELPFTVLKAPLAYADFANGQFVLPGFWDGDDKYNDKVIVCNYISNPKPSFDCSPNQHTVPEMTFTPIHSAYNPKERILYYYAEEKGGSKSKGGMLHTYSHSKGQQTFPIGTSDIIGLSYVPKGGSGKGLVIAFSDNEQFSVLAIHDDPKP